MSDITRVTQTPSLLRYYVTRSDGSAVEKTCLQIQDDMKEGPLKCVFSALTGSWGNGEDLGAPANPMNSPRISVIVTPLTYGGGVIATSAAIRFYAKSQEGGNINTMEVLGNKDTGTTVAALTNCIVEIRFNHSLE